MDPAVRMERSVALAVSEHTLDRVARGTPRTGIGMVWLVFSPSELQHQARRLLPSMP